MDIENTILSMLKENTGTHFLDSGGAYGRNWQRNQEKTLGYYKNQPEATVTIDNYRPDSPFLTLDVSLFHYLTSVLDVDTLCDEFNSMAVKDWDGDEFYGVSEDGQRWLLDHFELKGDSFNSYNWECPLDQVLQGREIECIESGDRYVILQVHGGADVRGGYTDAKLFKIECEYFLDVGCFWDVDFLGEWTNHEGASVSKDEVKELVKKHKVPAGNSKKFEASLYYCGM